MILGKGFRKPGGEGPPLEKAEPAYSVTTNPKTLLPGKGGTQGEESEVFK